jgi:hypothetical protein
VIGVNRSKLHVVPEAIDTQQWDPAKHRPLPDFSSLGLTQVFGQPKTDELRNQTFGECCLRLQGRGLWSKDNSAEAKWGFTCEVVLICKIGCSSIWNGRNINVNDPNKHHVSASFALNKKQANI